MQTAPLSSAAQGSGNDEAVEALGLTGATLMMLWSIGVARISDLTAYNTESLRKKLTESQKGSAGSRERIEKTLADVEAAMQARKQTLKPIPKEAVTRNASDDKREKATRGPTGTFEPDHEWLEKADDETPKFYRDPLETFYRDMRRYKRLLTREEQNELGRRVREHNDRAARDILVVHNLRLVLWIARKHLWATQARRMELSGLQLADLVQEGAFGLMIAADKYDYRKGFAFSTYASWWIRSKIGRAIMDSGFIRIPVHIGEVARKVQRAMEEIAIREGRPPTIDEVAALVELPPTRIRQALKAAQHNASMVSLDDSVGPANSQSDDEGTEMYLFIADATFLRPDRALEAKEELDGACGRLNKLTEALYEDGAIPERNREVFVRFYGLDGSLQRRMLEHVAEGFEITRERVRQIIQACWDKLQLSGIDMDHDSVVEDLKRIRELEKLTHKRVSAS